MRFEAPLPRSRILLWCNLFLLIICVFGGCPAYEQIQRSRHTPPEAVTSFADFLKWRPTTREFTITTIDGREHLEARGPKVTMFSSGDCLFTFDRKGKMVHFTLERGDDRAHWDHWWGKDRRSVTREEASRFIER